MFGGMASYVLFMHDIYFYEHAHIFAERKDRNGNQEDFTFGNVKEKAKTNNTWQLRKDEDKDKLLLEMSLYVL